MTQRGNLACRATAPSDTANQNQLPVRSNPAGLHFLERQPSSVRHLPLGPMPIYDLDADRWQIDGIERDISLNAVTHP